MRNASSQQGENSGSEKIKANLNIGNKILGKRKQQFLHKNNVTRKIYILVIQKGIVVVQNNGKERQKSLLYMQICCFAN